MSQEDARACVEKMKTDAVFRGRVLGAPDLPARTQLINAEGFACSAEEVDALAAELTDEEVGGVSGGMGVNRIVVTDGRISAKTD